MPRLKFSLFVVALVILVVLIEGDMLFHLLFEAVEIILELLEASLDAFFESVLGLSPRASQVLTAWLGVTIFLAIIWGLVSIYGLRVRHWYRETRTEVLFHFRHLQLVFQENRLVVYLLGTGILFLVFMFGF